MKNMDKCIIKIKTDIAEIKTIMKGIEADVIDIKDDIDGIMPTVTGQGKDIAVLKSEVEGVRDTWKEKEQTIDKSIGFYKTLVTVFGAINIALITLIGVFFGV